MIQEHARLLKTLDAAEFLGVSPRTLEALRLRGGGPKYYRLGRRACRYRMEDLEAYIQAGAAMSTSEESVR